MVEAMANSVEDYLIDGLSFKLSPGASYVTNRRNVTWYTSGSQIYVSGQGARVIRLQMNGDGWVDPSTVRLVYTLTNTATNAQVLRPISGPWSMFSRVRCMYQGAICDDISSYNRTHEMMSILTSRANRDNDDVEGFGRRWDSQNYYPDNFHRFIGPEVSLFDRASVAQRKNVYIHTHNHTLHVSIARHRQNLLFFSLLYLHGSNSASFELTFECKHGL